MSELKEAYIELVKPCWRVCTILLFLSSFVLVRGEDVDGFAVKKVNHEFIDLQGHSTDAVGSFVLKARYQKELESTPRVSGMRFHVMWRAESSPNTGLTVKLETRGLDGDTGKETRQSWIKLYPVGSDLDGTTVFDITGESWKKQGKMIAWRTTLLHGEQVMAERKAFLWDDTLRTSQKETKEQKSEQPIQKD
jgi:hypothetical protein